MIWYHLSVSGGFSDIKFFWSRQGLKLSTNFPGRDKVWNPPTIFLVKTRSQTVHQFSWSNCLPIFLIKTRSETVHQFYWSRPGLKLSTNFPGQDKVWNCPPVFLVKIRSETVYQEQINVALRQYYCFTSYWLNNPFVFPLRLVEGILVYEQDLNQSVHLTPIESYFPLFAHLFGELIVQAGSVVHPSYVLVVLTL